MNSELNRLDDEMAELSILLPRMQALALIDAAQTEGISVAQFMRRLVRQALDAAPAQQQFSLN